MRIGRIVLFAALATLCLLGGLTLVEGPDSPADLPAAPLPPLTAVIETADAVPCAAATDAVGREDGVRRYLQPGEMKEIRVLCAPVTDGNGCPLTARSYVHAAYAAFPLEDMPG